MARRKTLKKVGHAGRPAAQKRVQEMTPAELEEFTKVYDEPNVPTSPLTPAMRAEWERTRKPGRPRVGKGAQRVLITVERGLLQQADAYARQNGKTRSELIAMGLRRVMGGDAA